MYKSILFLSHPVIYYFISRIYLPLGYLGWVYANHNADAVLFPAFIIPLLIFSLGSLPIITIISRGFFRCQRNRPLEADRYSERYAGICVIYSLVVLIMLNWDLPILGVKGSDSMVVLEQESKLAWLLLCSLMVGKLGAASLMYTRSSPWAYGSVLLLLCIVTGKKGAILEFASIISMASLYYQSVFSVSSIASIFILIIGALFVHLRYQETLCPGCYSVMERLIMDPSETVSKLFDLFYYSCNVHFIQIYEWGGLNAFQEYGQLADPLNYFLNPVLKALHVGGVDQTLGVYLNKSIFGSTFPNGANMTLPVEAYAVSGWLGLIVACVIEAYLFIILFNNALPYEKPSRSFFISSMALNYIPYILADPLNGIKTLMFVYLVSICLSAILSISVRVRDQVIH